MSNAKSRDEVLKQLEQDGRVVAFRPALAEIGGGVTAGLMLAQMLYWTGKGQADGWFFKRQWEWELETGLGRREQETARRYLKERLLIEEKLKGIPARLHFRLRLDKVHEALDHLAKQPKQSARNGQTGASEGAEQFGPETSSKSAREGQAGEAEGDELLQENTQKTTSKTTARDSPNLFGADAPERDRGEGGASPEEGEGLEEGGIEEGDYVGGPEYLRDFHRMEEILEEEVGPYRDRAKQGAAIKWLLSQRRWTVEQCRDCLLAQVEEYAYEPNHIRASWDTVSRHIASYFTKKKYREELGLHPETRVL